MFRYMPRPKKDDGLTARERYEAKGERPGRLITMRFSDALLARIDRARGKKPRATWIKELIDAALTRRREKE